MITSIILAASIGYSADLDRAPVIQPWPRLAMAESLGDGTLPLKMGDPDDHKPKPKPEKKHHKHYCPPTCMPCKTCVPPPRTHGHHKRHYRKCCPPPRPCPPPTPHTTCAPPPCPPPMPHTTCAPVVRPRCFIFRRICW